MSSVNVVEHEDVSAVAGKTSAVRESQQATASLATPGLLRTALQSAGGGSVAGGSLPAEDSMPASTLAPPPPPPPQVSTPFDYQSRMQRLHRASILSRTVFIPGLTPADMDPMSPVREQLEVREYSERQILDFCPFQNGYLLEYTSERFIPQVLKMQLPVRDVGRPVVRRLLTVPEARELALLADVAALRSELVSVGRVPPPPVIPSEALFASSLLALQAAAARAAAPVASVGASAMFASADTAAAVSAPSAASPPILVPITPSISGSTPDDSALSRSSSGVHLSEPVSDRARLMLALDEIASLKLRLSKAEQDLQQEKIKRAQMVEELSLVGADLLPRAVPLRANAISHLVERARAVILQQGDRSLYVHQDGNLRNTPTAFHLREGLAVPGSISLMSPSTSGAFLRHRCSAFYTERASDGPEGGEELFRRDASFLIRTHPALPEGLFLLEAVTIAGMFMCNQDGKLRLVPGESSTRFLRDAAFHVLCLRRFSAS